MHRSSAAYLNNRASRARSAWRALAVLLGLALLVAACGPAASTSVPTQPALTPLPALPALALEECQLSLPAGQVRAFCGTLSVPEDRANPAGATIALKVMVVRAVSRTPAPDPLFLLAGGPGQAASEAFPPMLFAIERLRFKRDLVMVDQRGTGASNPLHCPDLAEETQVAGFEPPLEEQLALLEACRASLAIDPLLYTTQAAAADLDAVRAALGYQQVNLLGVSYGTRAAQEYLRQYPQRVRSLVLDGVVPPGWPLGASVGVDAQRALELVFARCGANAECTARYPDLPERFAALLDRLASSPVRLTVAHPRSGQPTEVELNQHSASATVRLMSYSDLLAALLPLAIDQAFQGDYSLLASQYLALAGELEQSLSLGMYYSVVCAEDAPFLPATAPGGETYLDPRLDDLRAACQRWLPAPDPAPAELAAPVVLNPSDAPTLLISGEADPVTPPANADAAAKVLPNSRHLVLPGKGHNNFYAGCLPVLIYTFLETLDPPSLDAACVQQIAPQPFFLTPLGPAP